MLALVVHTSSASASTVALWWLALGHGHVLPACRLLTMTCSMMLPAVRMQWWKCCSGGKVNQATYADCGGHEIFLQTHEHAINNKAKEGVRRTLLKG